MTDDRDAFEFLERMDLSVEDFVTKENFREALIGRFKVAGMDKPSDKQVDSLFKIGDETHISFPNSGIKRVLGFRFTGKNARFGIKGQRGLFGIDKAIKFLRGRGK